MMRAAAVLAAWSMIWLFAACGSSSPLDFPDAGRTAAFEPGVPNFDMEPIVRAEGDRLVVDVLYSFPMASLVFVQSKDAYEARYELVVQLSERESGKLVVEQSHRDTIRTAAFDSTISLDARSGRLTLDAPAGDLVLEAVMEDGETRATARRRQSVFVAALDSGEAYVSRIRLEGRGTEGSFQPLISMHLPAGIDSLRASVDLYNLSASDPMEVVLNLVRFKSDTSVASPPYWLEPSRGSLAYRGIDYTERDTVQTTRRLLRGAESAAAVEFALPRLDPGMYRLSIRSRGEAGASLIDRERMLSVKSSTFPRVELLDDLIDALAHIAYENELAAIREPSSPIERKRRFDAFWGTLVSSRNVAANVIELYYSRIEEANLFFSGYKEGWRTDRGMIFTILGPPIYVDRQVDVEVWHYSYGDRDPANTFVFERVQGDRDEPFETYILQRRPYYQNEWGRAIDRWRDGDIL